MELSIEMSTRTLDRAGLPSPRVRQQGDCPNPCLYRGGGYVGISTEITLLDMVFTFAGFVGYEGGLVDNPCVHGQTHITDPEEQRPGREAHPYRSIQDPLVTLFFYHF